MTANLESLDLVPLDAFNDLNAVRAEASAALLRPDADYVRWPFETIHDVTGAMSPGDVHFLAGRSGNGKTTFLRACVDRWTSAGIPTVVFPLETTPERYLTEWACVRLGILPGPVVSGTMPAADPRRRQVLLEMARMTRDLGNRGLVSLPLLEEHTANAFESALERAVDTIGARIAVVDHVDHIVGDRSQGGEYTDSVRVVRRGLDVAKQLGVIVIFATQLNSGIYAKGGHLAKYGAPRDEHIKMGQHKREVAAGMLGLFRPIRGQPQSETDAEYKEALKAAGTGAADPETVLDPDAVGVVVMKSRNFGSREGRRVYLRFNGGAIEDFPLKHDRTRR